MGDRANAVVRDENGREVFLYTHWRGTELAGCVARAIAKRWRWDDPAYFGRILFDVMTEGQHDQETGFGISTYVCDNEHPLIVIDFGAQKVSFRGDPSRSYADKEVSACTFTFEEIAADPKPFLQAYAYRPEK